jgi:hypothetical protein
LEDGTGSGTVTNTGTLTSGKVIIGDGAAIVKASKVTITDPATTATLTIVDNKTFTVNNTLTLATTDGATMTFPGGSKTVSVLQDAQTFTGKITFSPVSTASGLNVGAIAGDPSSGLANGDIWYDSTANKFRCREAGASVNCIGAGGSLPVVDTTSIVEGSADATKEIRFEVDGLTTGTVRVLTVQDSNYTLAGTDIAQTFGQAQGINASTSSAFFVGPSGDTNPALRVVTNVASAATGLSITGNAAGSGVTLAALSSGADENLKLIPKGNGIIWAQRSLYIQDGNRLAWTTNGSTIYAGLVGSTPNIIYLLDSVGNYPANVNFLAGPLGGFQWATTVGGAADTGIVRVGAAALRITDGSTGTGSLVIGPSTASIGTSGVAVLAIGNGTAPTTSPADEVQLWAADSAAGDSNLYARNEAGLVERLTGLTRRVSTQFDKTDTTLANVTNLSHNVEAGKAYAFEALLFVDADATGGSKYAIAGTATATSITYEIELLDDSTNVFTVADRQTALGGSSGQAGTTAGRCIVRGTIVVNLAGTLTVQFAQNAASGTSSVRVNSTFKIRQIGE